tara:strand:- start:52 stop:600 length:549 start_codon:yes stop_codon:yes gene_type:complete
MSEHKLCFFHDFIDQEESKKISNFILKNENYIKSLGEDTYVATSNNSLTGRYNVYNYLQHMPGEILIPKIKNIFGKCLVQCWANTFRKNEGIETHIHGPSKDSKNIICGNLFLSGPTYGTYYKDKSIESEVGTLILFSLDHPHGVLPNPTECVRVSMAFDIYADPSVFGMINEEPHRFFLIE